MHSPLEIARNYIEVGIHKVNLSIFKTILLGFFAGMFIGFAGIASTTASSTIGIASVAKLVGAAVFPAGMAMVLVAGSELFTGNNLIILAVLEKKAGIHLAASDAYVNIAGGMKMTEPAIDLGICLAIISSAKDIVIPDSVMVFGEIGLSGEVRAVSMAGQRVQEAKKLGFETVILPEVNRAATESIRGIQLVYVAGIRDANSYIMR